MERPWHDVVRHTRADEPEAPDGAYGDRDRPRRRDDQRDVRPHGLDRPGLRQDLHGRPSGLRRGDQRQVGVRHVAVGRLAHAHVRRVSPPEGAGALRGRTGRGKRQQRVHAPDRQRRQGDPVRSRRFSESRLLHRERNVALQSFHPRHGHLAGTWRGRHRQRDGLEEASRSRSGHRRPGGRAGSDVPGLRDHAVQLWAHDRGRHARGLRPPDGAGPLRKARAIGRDRGRREAERHRARSS